MNVYDEEEILNISHLFYDCKRKKIAAKGRQIKKFGLNHGYSREKPWECITH